MAAFAAESVVKLLSLPGERWPFSSRAVQRAFRACSYFSVPSLVEVQSEELGSDAKLIGSLLHKVAYRGVPAPCSLAVEQYILTKAQSAEVLAFEHKPTAVESPSDREELASFEFSCDPLLPNLQGMLQACMLPELLIGDEELDLLFARYQGLCNSAEQRVFQQFVKALPDPRLALFLRPQRKFNSMCKDADNAGIPTGSRVDFALEIPPVSGGRRIRMVVEVDGIQHSSPAQLALDQKRDTVLEKNGWGILRLSTLDETGWHAAVEHLGEKMVEDANLWPIIEAAEDLRKLPSEQRSAIVEMIQLPLAEAQLIAVAAHVLSSQGSFEYLTVSSRMGDGLNVVLDAVNTWIKTFESLHGIARQGRLIAFENIGEPNLLLEMHPSAGSWRFDSHSMLTHNPAASQCGESLISAQPRPVNIVGDGIDALRRDLVRSSLVHLLENIFRKVRFLDGQLRIIEHALAMRNVIGLLPTGSGKSLCYQLIGYTQPGMTLVVSPLRALMIDQREGLYAFGIHRSVELISSKGKNAAAAQAIRKKEISAMANGRYQFVLVAPERLQIPTFLEGMKGLIANVPIPYCVIDEVHCLSEWGHDFRPAYLNINKLVRRYCSHLGSHHPVLYGLTATASQNVLTDIKRELSIPADDPSSVIQPRSFNRSELEYSFIKVSRDDHLDGIANVVANLLQEYRKPPSEADSRGLPGGLIFHYFVNGSKGSDSVTHLARELGTRLGIEFPIYAGSKPREPFFVGTDEQWESRKRSTQLKFKTGREPLLVCSHSFGMGIDKPDVRFTVHAILPRSAEEFYQQSGRAGRDRRSAKSVVVYVEDDQHIVRSLWQADRFTLDHVRSIANKVPKEYQGDITRNLWFLTNSFIGEDSEKEILEWILTHSIVKRMSSESQSPELRLSFYAIPEEIIRSAIGGGRSEKVEVTPEDQESILEKSLYRLSQIGIVSEYQKDYTQRRFLVTLSRSSPEAIVEALDRYLARYTQDQNDTVSDYRLTSSFEDIAQAAAAAVGKIVEFTYGTILKQRRQAQVTMLRYANLCNDDGPLAFRVQLLSYLGEGRFAAPIAELRSETVREDVPRILKMIVVNQPRDVVELIGACDRRLEDEPDNAALLMLAGIGRLANDAVADGVQDFRRGFRGIGLRLSATERADLAEHTIVEVLRVAPSSLLHVLNSICEEDESIEVRRAAARASYQDPSISDEVRHAALQWLSWCVATEVRSRLGHAA